MVENDLAFGELPAVAPVPQHVGSLADEKVCLVFESVLIDQKPAAYGDLFGGFNGTAALNETWTWDGATWTQLSPTTSPSARAGASMAYDPERDGHLQLIEAPHLFAQNVTQIALRRGRYLRGYAYRFIELCSPGLNEAAIRAALTPPQAPDIDV